MTSPESPNMDRLREVVTEAIDAVIDGWMQGDPWPDEERLADAVLAALLPVHRAMVLEEAADALTEAGSDPLRNAAWMYADEAAALVRHFAASTPPGAPGSPPAAERATPSEMGTVENDADFWFRVCVNTATRSGLPCPRCAHPTKAHWPDDDRRRPGCQRCLCSYTPQSLLIAADAAVPVETGTVERVGRFEELLAAEYEQFDQRGELLRSITEYADAPTLAVSSPPATVPGTGDDQAACDRCRRRFDPDDKDPAGAARYAESKFCRGCVDRCHESTDAFHECPVCAS